MREQDGLVAAAVKLANSCARAGDLTSAAQIIERAILASPAEAKLRYLLGVLMRRQGKPADAIESLNAALRMRPDDPAALYELGVCYLDGRDLDSAIRTLARAIDLDPSFAKSHYRLGIALLSRGKPEKAVMCLAEAMNKCTYPKDSPFHFLVYHHAGIAFLWLGIYDKALKMQRRAIKIQPADHLAVREVANILLLLGHYQEGWKWQLVRERLLYAASSQDRLWDGSGVSAGTRLLILTGQGLGDVIQYSRYLPLLEAMGIYCTLVTSAKLHGLLRSSGIKCSLVSSGDSLPQYERWTTMQTLPAKFGESPSTPVASPLKITPKTTLVKKWRDIRPHGQYVIGINWHGSDKSPHDLALASRNIALSHFTDIAEMTNVTLVSLQKGPGSEQLTTSPLQQYCVHYQKEVDNAWDFEESAAIIEACDLVITCDTVVAHLSGSLGKETWMLLSNRPTWRWGLESESTFWYPSLRIYRQLDDQGWSELFQRVTKDLTARLSAAY